MNLPRNTFFYLFVVENPGLLLESRRYLSLFWRYKYFRFGRPYCYFRFLIVVEITVFELAIVDSYTFTVGKRHIPYAYRFFSIKTSGAFLSEALQKCVKIEAR